MTDRIDDEEELEAELERTRQLILERRNRFMAAALAGIGMATGGCTRASVCLDVPVDNGGSGGTGESGGAGGRTATSGTGGSGCPAQPWRQPPCVCLTAPTAGTQYPPFGGTWVVTAGGSGAGGTGGAAGTAGTRPTVCLEPPIDEDAGTENEP